MTQQTQQPRPTIRELLDDLSGQLQDRTVTVQDVATVFGVHPTTVRRWADAGLLKSFRTPGNQRRFWLSDVRDCVERHRRYQRYE